MVEVILSLGEITGSHARKSFDVANKMGLIREVEGIGNIGQFFKLSGFDKSYRCLKTLYPKIGLG